MEDTAGRILIKSPNWVGDVVMSIPAIKELRGLYPDSYIAVLIKQELADLLVNNPAINEIITYKEEKGLKKLSMIGRIRDTIRAWDFDTAILFPNSFSSALIAFLAGIPRRVGYGSDGRSFLLTNPIKVKDENKSIHQACIYLDLIKHLYGISKNKRDCFAIARNDPAFVIARSVATKQSNSIGISSNVSSMQICLSSEIHINEKDREWAVSLVKEKIRKGKYLIGINPGARFGPAKRWLAERFIDLVNRLTLEFNASLILFGGPEEKEFVSGIAAGIKSPQSPLCQRGGNGSLSFCFSKSPPPPFNKGGQEGDLDGQQGDVLNMAGSTSLGQLAGLIERCNVFITNDTGPMHIAYSVGTPVVAIFGSTDPNRTGPLGNNYKIVKKDVPCSPCFKRVCPFDMECMKAITVDDVIEAVEYFIQ